MKSDSEVISAILQARHRRWTWKLRDFCLFVEERDRRHAKARCRRKPQNHHPNQGYAVEEMDRLDPAIFKRMFRVDRASFSVILELIEPFMEKQNEQKAMNSSGCVISMKMQLAVTLRWLAGGSHLDMSFPHNDPAQLEEMSKGFLTTQVAFLMAASSQLMVLGLNAIVHIKVRISGGKIIIFEKEDLQ
jgi:hypothetical protein